VLPLAVSGPIVIGVAVVSAAALLMYVLKREGEEDAGDGPDSDT
jgi:hypothetical protein